MNKILICAFGAFLGFTSAQAQTCKVESQGAVTVADSRIAREGGQLNVGLTLDLSKLDVKKSQAAEVIPVLLNGEDTLRLPKLYVTGKTRHILYERMSDKQRAGFHETLRHNGKAQTYDYAESVAYEPWMAKSRLVLITDKCGCGWKIDPESVAATDVRQLGFKELSDYVPTLAFIAPQLEAKKTRQLSGQAYLDFPVNKTEIYPDYRNNPTELRRIQATIDSVRGNEYAKVTGVTIKGYASPEGKYDRNAYLAENRAKALIGYVKGLYHFQGVKFTVESEAEDWVGLERFVEKSTMNYKDEVLSVVRGSIADPDEREAALKRIGGGEPYRFLLASAYPALRHSDYFIDYEIRPLTLEESERLIYTKPELLSMDEMYRVARQYEPGSEKFCEIFDIALRAYPTDPVSNLNAANSMLLRGDVDGAAARLTYVPDSCGEKQLALGAIALKRGDVELARNLFEKAKKAGVAEADENLKFLEELN